MKKYFFPTPLKLLIIVYVAIIIYCLYFLSKSNDIILVLLLPILIVGVATFLLIDVILINVLKSMKKLILIEDLVGLISLAIHCLVFWGVIRAI